MKKTDISLLLNIVLVAALGIVLWQTSSPKVESEKESAGPSSAYDCIMTRTSIREFTAEPVAKSAVDTILRAAMAAPTAGDKRPWNFIVINNRQTLDSLAATADAWAPVGRAPMAVVVAGNVKKTFPGEGELYWVEDCSAASENLLLAAHSLGLGAVWCGAFPIQERVRTLSASLQLPDSIVPLGIIAVGHPAQNPEPKNKFDFHAIRYNSWK